LAKTPEEFIAIRNNFKPEKISLIFLFESPMHDGGYFYDHKSLKSDLVFKPMMKLIDFKYNFLNEQIKLQGLKKFKESGYFTVDATYQPVNTITNEGVKNNLILKNSAGLIEDLKSINAHKEQTPIIIVRSNLFKLYNQKLLKEGFNVINESIIVPFMANNKEERFHRKILEIFMCRVIVANPLLRSMYLPYGTPHENAVKPKKTRAIILGTDPSNFDDKGKTFVMSHAFDIQNPKSRYWQFIFDNVKYLGLDKTSVYMQYLVRNYMNKITRDNGYWYEFAEIWKSMLMEDLDKFDPERKFPVLALSEFVITALLNEPDKHNIPFDKYYEQNIIIQPEENYLERRLIPCFTETMSYSNNPAFVKFIREFIPEAEESTEEKHTPAKKSQVFSKKKR